MIYVVQPGDTVFQLARRFGVSQADIVYLNQIPAPFDLAVGQTLWIGARTVPGTPEIQVNGFAYPYISPWVLEQTLPYLSLLSVFSYGFTPDGDLLPPPLTDSRLLERAKANNVETAMVLAPIGADGMFSNLLIHQVVSNPAARARLLSQAADTMQEKGYRELNIDFEYVLAGNRDDFSSFVEQAAETLHPLGFRVSVDLAPKTSADQPGTLYEGMDYARLGAAADRVLLMTYEWGYKYGPPQAVAPIDPVRQVVDYALTEIPAEKISLGLANYGYDWPLPFVQNRTAARTLGLVEAVELAKRVGAEIHFDEKAQSPWFEYTNLGIRHTVWFEDLRSWQAKFDLIREKKLTGLGIWQIMQLYRAGLALIGDQFEPESPAP